MPIDAETLRQLRHLLRPIETRIVNMAGRATVQLVDDTAKMQLVQLGGIVGGPYPGVEHVQPYGFSSVPLVGADTAIVIFPNGDRSHALLIGAADRRYRPTGGDPGDVNVYHFTGARIRMTQDGDIVVAPAPGRDVLVGDGGSVDALVKRSEFLAHGHATAATGPVSPPTAATAAPDVGQFPGTQALRSE